MADKVYGARTKVFIQFEGTLQDLGTKMEKGLNISTLRYENMEDEPYDLVGYAEVLGFEVELRSMQNSDKWPDYQFLLEATTTDSFQEVFNDRMFDISLWMARYLSLTCEVTTLAENLNNQTGQSFYLNKTTSKRESSSVEAKK
ncbi:hypothetical protein [Cohnella hashimotonis]|uniref:Uncharacterized protein n=1 Tax=Cohnella hashimotonis TaxID=2826895 RepID=A0ABT6TLZ1_9BACL|nr:hypothetical protein [Cohnella hashimotonis]MDI4647868.1 hypothetical protein [Cohnella hashimotonis]